MDNYFAEALWKLCENDELIGEFIIADPDNLGEILRKLCEYYGSYAKMMN